VNLEAIEPSLAVVDRWLDRREVTGASLRGALESLAERRLTAWSRFASVSAIGEVRAVLRDRGAEHIGAHMGAHVRDPASANPSESDAPRVAPASAVDLLRRLTQAHGAEAYEIVEQAFRRSIAKFGARFVATHARAAIDETMGPMHSTVVAADLLSMLERLDTRYLESLTFALETMHDWGVVAARTAESREKTRPTGKRAPRALSSPKRRA
jgi:hypothetical protein